MGLDTERMASLLGFFSVSPACAGMIPTTMPRSSANTREPRMRGDDPFAEGMTEAVEG